MWGFGGLAARGWGGEADRWQQLIRLGETGGERRRLFDGGEGPAEAVAEPKQESMGARRKQFVKKFVCEQ